MSYNSFALKSLLQRDHVASVLERLGAHGIDTRDTNGIRCSCPIHGSKGNTVFVYNDVKHLYNCYGGCNEDDNAGDIITLVQKVHKCGFDVAVQFICEASGIDIRLIEQYEEYILEELKNRLDNIMKEVYPDALVDVNLEWEYGVPPMKEEIYSQFIGQKDQEGFIDMLGISAPILTLFESGFDSNENRWLLPIRTPDGILLGLDGRDTTNKRKDKWRKRAGLLTNKLLGRLDITKPHILEKDEIIIVEGKKDMMCVYDAGIFNVSCTYGSSLSDHQKKTIDGLCSKIVIIPDGDEAGYKHVQTIVKKCYPEYEIVVAETPDNEDPGTLSKKFLLEIYDNAIAVEEWLDIYKYREPKKKKK